ncbi:hypothetical protein [Pyrococcus horikoshii]|nr:hypothetical protein [Pyrococcus horikoshii]HII60216.1 hypothetical protein [Pyrococcus horikoshii]
MSYKLVFEMPQRVRLPAKYRREWDLVRVTTSQENLVKTLFKLSNYIGSAEISIVKGKKNVGEARIIKDGENVYTMVAFYKESPYIPDSVTFYIAAPLKDSAKFITKMVAMFDEIKEINEEIQGNEVIITFKSKVRRVGPFSSLNEEENVKIEMEKKNLDNCLELRVKRMKVGAIELEMSERKP